ncbi:MAG: hypothetical protein ACI8RD_002306 [Bacillariaceae sp.]|jgi:hypothetical protein
MLNIIRAIIITCCKVEGLLLHSSIFLFVCIHVLSYANLLLLIMILLNNLQLLLFAT